MTVPRILIVEDDGDWLEIYRRCLKNKDYEIVPTRRLETALSLLKQQHFDIVLTDLKMFGGRETFSGFGVLEQARTLNPEIQVIVITGYGSAEHALRAMGSGAYDYITKDRDLRQKLPLTIQSALEVQLLKHEFLDTRFRDDVSVESNRIIGNSPSMQALFGEVTHAAQNDTNVLICGEEGTGKRLLAQTIHRQSSRKNAPFFVIDCGSLSELQLESEILGYAAETQGAGALPRIGKFERANGGTIFLDGITYLDIRSQARIGNVLSEEQVIRVGEQEPVKINIRVIASTHKRLDDMLATENFRRSLFDLLNETSISVPPLRDRKNGDDILALAAMFLQRHSKNAQVVFSAEAVSLLNQYNYPGNVRELESIVKHALTRCKGTIIKSQHLRVEVRKPLQGLKKSHDKLQLQENREITLTQAINTKPLNQDLTELRLKLNNHFDNSELRELCFDLGVDYDNLAGTKKTDKTMELIYHLQRRDELSKLLEICRRLRPGVGW